MTGIYLLSLELKSRGLFCAQIIACHCTNQVCAYVISFYFSMEEGKRKEEVLVRKYMYDIKESVFYCSTGAKSSLKERRKNVLYVCLLCGWNCFCLFFILFLFVFFG